MNLQKLTEKIPYTHFKMATGDTIYITILKKITPCCYIAKLGNKDTHYSIPILEKYQGHLKVVFGAKRYQFTCLLNDLCCRPRMFTKLLKAPLHFYVKG